MSTMRQGHPGQEKGGGRDATFLNFFFYFLSPVPVLFY